MPDQPHGDAPPVPAEAPPPTAEVTAPADLLALHARHDPRRVNLGHGIAGRLRRALARLLAPWLQVEADYHAANARLASRLWEGLEAVTLREAERHRSLEKALALAISALREELLAPILRLEREGAELRADLNDTRTRQAAELARRLDLLATDQGAALDRLARAITDEVHRALAPPAPDAPAPAAALLPGAAPAPGQTGAPLAAAPPPPDLDAFYADFEDRFRGKPDVIKERLRTYLPLVRDAPRDRPVLDLGSGRGEWLELLRDEGIVARGFERNRSFLATCRARRLAVTEGDLLALLERVAPASASVVSAFHVIEHLPFDQVVRLLDLAARALATGGLLLLETPNPENIQVATHTFHLDPTHHRPWPSAVMTFAAESRGFTRVRIVPLHPYEDVEKVGDDGTNLGRRFDHFFYGPRDYALVAWKT